MSEGYSFHGSPGAGRKGDRLLAGLVLVLVVAFVSVAIVKPWGTPAAPTTTPGASPSHIAPAVSIPMTRPLAPSPEAMMAPAPLPVAFTTPVPAPAAAPWSTLSWRRLAPDDPLSLVTSVLRWRGGFVAIGRHNGIPATPVWTSADGTHWLPLLFDTSTNDPPTTFWQGLAVLGLAARPTGLVALTEALPYCSAPCLPAYVLPVVSWTSGDGRRWMPHLLPPEWLARPAGRPPLFADGPAGMVVASSGSAARVATSIDGTHWQLLPARAFPARFAFSDLFGTVTGYVAVGRWMTTDTRSVAGSLWSSDGQQWSEMPTILPTTQSASDVESAVASLVVGRGGMIAVGGGATPGATLWWQSVDGRRWQLLPGNPPLGPTTCVGEGCGSQPDGSLVGDGGRMVALRGGAGASIWASTDGLVWRTLAVTGDVPDAQATTAGMGNQPVLLPGGILVSDGTTTWFGEAGTE